MLHIFNSIIRWILIHLYHYFLYYYLVRINFKFKILFNQTENILAWDKSYIFKQRFFAKSCGLISFIISSLRIMFFILLYV